MNATHTIRRRVTGVLICAALLLALLPPAAPVAYAAGISSKSGDKNAADLSRSEIVQLLKDTPVTMPKEVFDAQPQCSAPYAAGALKTPVQQQAVNRLNALRRIAGLPPVTLDTSLSADAQYGAVLLAASNFSHYPDQPADMDDAFYEAGKKATSSSNLYAGRTLILAVDGFMDDSDKTNVDRLGHRRWQINPTMGKVGFGYATASTRYGRYVTEKVFDRSGAGCDYDWVGWPASGNFPSTQFASHTAWSVSLNPDQFQKPERKAVTVTLTRKSDGKVWTLRGSKSYTAASSGLYMNVNTQGYGIANCIIFRPDLANDYKYEGVWSAVIEGLKDTDGNSVTLRYEVDFFDPDTYDAASGTGFTDVAANAWYAPYVERIVKDGSMMQGVGNNRFNPTGTLTMGEVVVLAARVYASEHNETIPENTSGAWYDASYRYCVEKGILTAADTPMTRPASRTEMVVLLDRAVSDTRTAPLRDVQMIPDVSYESGTQSEVIYRWYRAGIVGGDQNGRFNGSTTITRADTATILCRLLGLTERLS